MECKLKICGLRCPEDIEAVNKYDEISYAGFIFAEKSPRYVSPDAAAELIKRLRRDIIPVGVFVNTPIAEVNIIAARTGISIVQLHSSETNEDCRMAARPVWKAFSVKDTPPDLSAFPYAMGYLLDTYSEDARGGTGKSFNWELARGLCGKNFIILAGGLNPDNIAQAASIVRPAVLDVNSGVETELKKDPAKIDLLIRRLNNGA